jgi:hypothetical protein
MPMICRLSPMLLLLLALGACGSMAKGVTEAILEQRETEDSRLCHIQGPTSHGLESLLDAQERDRAEGRRGRQLKVLMVHGIGHHLPGYSGRLTENLMDALGLDLRQENSKEFTLRAPGFPDRSLGHLRVDRYTNKARTRELIFYELTWSEITEERKKVIAFDQSAEHASRRAPLNSFMKQFFNSHIPDPLIYLGEAQLEILSSVHQSFCWMTSGDWNDYPAVSDQTCDSQNLGRQQILEEDDLVIVTHSLGSRIAIDVLQEVGEWSSRQTDPDQLAFREIVQDKELRVYMLANQLPLLELGREPAAVRGQIAAHCQAGGALADQRLVGETSIYAFSDPNDILSYPVPPKFANDYIDSRLCPRITNVTLNVAKPVSLFGLSDVADPLAAHVNYDHDARVIALMVHGVGDQSGSDLIREKCTWTETTVEE